MPAKNPTIDTPVTIKQKQSIKELSAMIGEGQAAIVRRKLKEECERYGVVWPDDMPQHGGKRNTK